MRQKRVAIAIASLLFLALYPMYLVAGGDFGREYIKAKLAVWRASSTFVLSKDDAGGDCAKIGDWQQKESVCAFQRDLTAGETIRISGDGLTLDGNGHRMQSSGPGVAVTAIGTRRVTVKNLTISGYETGVYLQYATETKVVENNILGGALHAIHLTGNSNFNSIAHNRLSGFKMHGVALWSSHGNFIAANQINSVRDGVRLQSSDANVLTLNDIRDVRVEGVDLHLSRSNRIFLNNIHGSSPIPILDDASASDYSLGRLGNYYSRHDSTNSGCIDSNDDGRCDRAYKFAFGVDSGAIALPVKVVELLRSGEKSDSGKSHIEARPAAFPK